MNSLNKSQQNTIRLDAQNGDDIKRAASILKNFGTVALPTETVYGLAAHALNAHAINKVFAAKNRPLNNPLILHVSDKEKALELFDSQISNPRFKRRFDALADAFWPGPLTMIFNRASFIPKKAVGNLTTAAVRVPNHYATLSILKLIDFPVVMPSANLSSRPSPTTAAHVLKTLEGRIDAVVDGGDCDVGIESTVIKIDGESVVLLRPGSVNKLMLENVLQEIVVVNEPQNQLRPLSPGLSYLHYSPKVSSVTVVDKAAMANHWHGTGTVLLKCEDFDAMNEREGSRPMHAHTFILSDDPKQCARELYRCLHACEQIADQPLFILLPEDPKEEWCAVIDRLTRSAGFLSMSC